MTYTVAAAAEVSVSSQALVAGLTNGIAYSLLAMGLVLSYRATRVLNLAHGETLVIGGATTYGLTQAGVPLVLAAVCGVVAAIAFNVFLDAVLLEPRRNWAPSSLVLLTLAAALTVHGVLWLTFGTEARTFPAFLDGDSFRVAGASISLQQLLLIVIGGSACLGCALILTRSSLGKRMSATASDPEAAQLLGVNTFAARRWAYALAGGMGGLAAVLLVPLIAIDYQSGLGFTLRGFIAAALAGLWSPQRAVFAGMALGLVEAFAVAQVGSLYRDPIVFSVLILVALLGARSTKFGGVARA